MFQGLTGFHLVIILGIIVLLFGATRLPALAKGLGQSINIFKKEMGTDEHANTTTPGVATTAAPVVPPAATVQPTVQQEPVVNPAPSVQPQSDPRV